MAQRVPDLSVNVADGDLLLPTGPLRAALIAFGQCERFAGEFRSVYANRFGTTEPATRRTNEGAG